MKEIPKTFNMRRMRADHGLKQSDVAAVLKLPQSSICAMENGKTPISKMQINIIEEKLKISDIEQYINEVNHSNYVTNVKGSNNGNHNDYNVGKPSKQTASDSMQNVLDYLQASTLEASSNERRLNRINSKLVAENTVLRMLCKIHNIDFKDAVAEALEQLKETEEFTK